MAAWNARMLRPVWLVVCGLVALSGNGLADERSGLVFDEPQVSLGRIEVAGNIEQRFAFQVTGREPVQILDIRPSCGCIQPVLSKRVYQPGERDVLVFGVHATSQQQGPRRYQVSLTVRQGGAVSVATVTLEMELIKPIVITPSNLLLHMNGGNAMEQTLTVAEARPRPLQILGVSTSSSRVQARLADAPRDDPHVRQVSLTVAGDFPVGRSEETVTIRTTDPENPELVVPLTIVRASRVRVLPDRLHGSIATTERGPAVWQVLLSDSKGEPIQIDSVVCRDSSVTVRWPSQATNRCRIRVEVSPPKGVRPYETEVVVRIAAPLATELTLPVRLD